MKKIRKYCFNMLASTVACVLLFSAVVQAQAVVSFNGEKSSWHEGFVRYDMIMDDSTLTITPFKAPEKEGSGIQDPPAGKHRCVVITPKNAAPGNPWSWRGCYWDHQPQTEVELLRRGFYVAYISASAALRPGRQWDAWYAFLIEHGLSEKPAFIGMSRGGEYEYTWATAHPGKVSCIYADNPAVPYDLLTKLGSLAMYDVPLLHVCGSIDPLYNIATGPVENIYQQFGGRISVMVKEGFGHHPHSLHDPRIIADFIEQSSKEKKRDMPAFAGVRPVASWFFGNNYTYRFFPAEDAYITCRGPVFTSAYRRYLVQITGVDAFTTIISPEKPAPGNPWVFRADPVRRDDTVDLALLGKGYYIVTGAVPYNYEGPVLDQWNKIYQYLTGYGFSAKPVIGGNGGAAGEAIAWAIENPDRVGCIYAVNPVLTSKVMIRTPLPDTLMPLAKAKVPLLFVCGSNDPSLNSQALAARKKYRQLGGKIDVVIKHAEGHYLSPFDPGLVLNFIAMHAI